MTREKFNEYIHKHGMNLYGYAYRILRNQEDAEDAVQDVFIKLWKMGERLDEYKSIEALATTMIKNHCIDQLRRQKLMILNDDGDQARVSDALPSPHELMETKESGMIIIDIIEKLDPKYKLIVELREICELSYEEIADKTGLNINTLRVILSRARSLIREEYKKYNNERKGIKQATGKIL